MERNQQRIINHYLNVKKNYMRIFEIVEKTKYQHQDQKIITIFVIPRATSLLVIIRM